MTFICGFIICLIGFYVPSFNTAQQPIAVGYAAHPPTRTQHMSHPTSRLSTGAGASATWPISSRTTSSPRRSETCPGSTGRLSASMGPTWAPSSWRWSSSPPCSSRCGLARLDLLSSLYIAPTSPRFVFPGAVWPAWKHRLSASTAHIQARPFPPPLVLISTSFLSVRRIAPCRRHGEIRDTHRLGHHAWRLDRVLRVVRPQVPNILQGAPYARPEVRPVVLRGPTSRHTNPPLPSPRCGLARLNAPASTPFQAHQPLLLCIFLFFSPTGRGTDRVSPPRDHLQRPQGALFDEPARFDVHTAGILCLKLEVLAHHSYC